MAWPARAFLAVLLLAQPALSSPAMAQRGAPPLPLPPPPAPSYEADATSAEAVPSWAMACTEATAEVPRSCRVSTTVLLRPGNTPLAQILLTRQRESRSLALIFQLPHGTWLQGGIAWQTDEAPPQRLAFQSSDAAGVYAATVVTDDVLATLRAAATLRLSFVAAARRQTLAVPIPLEGFGDAVAAMLTAEATTP